jgi:hypothetical protein
MHSAVCSRTNHHDLRAPGAMILLVGSLSRRCKFCSSKCTTCSARGGPGYVQIIRGRAQCCAEAFAHCYQGKSAGGCNNSQHATQSIGHAEVSRPEHHRAKPSMHTAPRARDPARLQHSNTSRSVQHCTCTAWLHAPLSGIAASVTQMSNCIQHMSTQAQTHKSCSTCCSAAAQT